MKKLPRYSLILIPGAGDSVNNEFFKGRINAAAEIFNSQKIKKIIVSGRNDLPGYDEPADMETALIERGISHGIIEKDYGANRTLQSVLLAKEELKKDSVIIVSQKAHLERALFISRASRLKAVGYIAKENYTVRYRKYRTVREVLARLKCTVDCLKIWVNG
ncbi:MAG: ElyC/SanA/YdcF family protein [Bacteroidota bacterium]